MIGADPAFHERFWTKVRKGEGCWEWIAALTTKGYGHISVGGRLRAAHRIAYEMLKGEIPAGLQIDHLCRNRACVNPDHLEAVTPRENTRRSPTASTLNALKTHCPQGHPYSPENTAPVKTGGRRCRACALAHNRRHRERMRAKRQEYSDA